jgi:NADH:ubiquinone oxidoreductase subunit 5 (subunit L)/multisubunit Na+/H+ antiporter MnhA subunit
VRGGPPREGNILVGYGMAWLVALAGYAGARSLYANGRALAGDEKLERMFPRLRRALVNKLYVDEFYDWLIVRPIWRLAKGLWRVVDATLIDGLLVNGIAQLVAGIGSLARRFQNGNVQRYAAMTALGVAALVYVFLVRS